MVIKNLIRHRKNSLREFSLQMRFKKFKVKLPREDVHFNFSALIHYEDDNKSKN